MCFKNDKFLCLADLLRTDWRGCSEVCLKYAQGSMTHVKDMSDSNLVVPWLMRQALYLLKCGCLHQQRDPNSIPSYYNMMRHDDIARASGSRDAFVRQSGSFLFPPYCLRESKKAQYYRLSYEVITMMSRFDKMSLRWPSEGQTGHTESTRKLTFASTSVNFFECQRFCLCSQSCCRSL